MGDMADDAYDRLEAERDKRSYGKRTPTAQRTRSTKGTTMSERMTKAQIEHELRVNSELITTLRQRRQDLTKQLKTAIPAEPQSPFVIFSVMVKFKLSGKSYQYLILRSGGQYWTTGTKQDQQVFSSWESLCEWLEGPDVYSHSDLVILTSSGKVVSFDSGRVENHDTSQAPY